MSSYCQITSSILFLCVSLLCTTAEIARANSKEDKDERNDQQALQKSLEKFVVESARTAGNVTTISITKWQSEVGSLSSTWTPEETARNMVEAFERTHLQFDVYQSIPIYEMEKKGYLELSYVWLRHRKASGIPKRY